LPHNIHRNACAVQESFWEGVAMLSFAGKE